MRLSFIISLFILLPLISFSQSRKVWLYHADDFYNKADYQNALVNYEKALSDSVGLQYATIPYEITQSNLKIDKKERDLDTARTVPLTDYIQHQIAMCYMNTYDYKRAVDHFSRTSSLNSYPEDIYHFGVAQMNMDQHKDAIQTFEKYIKSEKYHDSLLRSAQLLITGCYYALEETSLKKEVKVSLLDTNVFNKGTSSFAPMWFGDQDKIMFTSAREGGILLDPKKQESEYLCDLYWTQRKGEQWDEAVNFGRPLNSAIHDASGMYYNDPSRSNEYSIIYYTRWSDNNRKEKSIHFARMQDMLFYESFKLPESVNVPGYSSINPFVTMDGKWMYFSSDRPGGEGGLDLWVIELDEMGHPLGKAKNLGRPVNSELDEQSPYLHEISSTLFFSSNGHNSIGGQDLFKSMFDLDNKAYGRPENLGMPINSSMDDSYIIWDDYLQKGYFSSDREPCENGHCYNIYEVTNEPIKITLEGYAYDMYTNQILPNTTITFKDVDFKFETFDLKTDENGYYFKELDQNQEIFLKATKPQYFADASAISTKPITKTTKLIHDFYLRIIPQEEIEIEGIEYDFDKATLRPASEEALNKLYDFLALNGSLIVEINSHTDARGSDSYNKNLSQRRAKSCVEYLISKGINKDRLKAIGYGEEKPNYLKDKNKNPILDPNGNKILLTEDYIAKEKNEDKQEEYHQRNRRTSFKVVGTDFELKSE